VLLQFRRLCFHDTTIDLLDMNGPVYLKDAKKRQVWMRHSTVILPAIHQFQFNQRFWISKWFFFWLLTIDVSELKEVNIFTSIQRREQYMENLNESSAESLAKLTLFRGMRSIKMDSFLRNSLDLSICQTRAAKWDLHGVTMDLDYVTSSQGSLASALSKPAMQAAS